MRKEDLRPKRTLLPRYLLACRGADHIVADPDQDSTDVLSVARDVGLQG